MSPTRSPCPCLPEVSTCGFTERSSDPILGFNGWIEATSATSGLAGFFLNGNPAMSDLDGAAVSPPGTEFILPFVSEDGTSVTEISLVNSNSGPASASLTLYASSGTRIGAATLIVPARGLIRQTMSGLFPSLDPGSASHLHVQSDLPLAGMELLADFQVPEAPSRRRESAILTGQPLDRSERSVLSQFISGAEWISYIGVVNAAGIGQELTLTAYGPDGTLWEGVTNPARVPLGPHETLRLGAAELFGFPSDELRTGWIQVDAALGQAVAFAGLGHRTTSSFALIPGVDLSPASTDFALAFFADDADFFTGLTLNNPGEADAAVDVFVLRDDGTTIGQRTLAVPAAESAAALFGDLVPAGASESQLWAYLRSDQSIVVSALMGTTDGLSLVNVNPQRLAGAFLPPAQTTAAITGTVTQGGLGAPGVTITLTGPANLVETTEASGRYVFAELPAGTYTVTPSAAGAQFIPAARTVRLGPANVDGIDFESGGVIPAGVPQISFITPAATFAGNTALNLQVGGTAFSPASVVEVNGTPLKTTYVSAAELQAVLPVGSVAQPGFLSVRVVTPPPGGGSSSSFDFQVNSAPDDPLIAGRVAVGGFPAGVALDPDRNQALIASESSDAVFFVDLDGPRVTGEVRVGRSPAEIDIDAELGLAVVANVGSNTVSIIDVASRTVVGTVPVGRFPMGVAVVPGAGRALVVSGEEDHVAIIDVLAARLITTIPVGERPAGVAVDPRTNRAFVTLRSANQTAVIDLDSRALVGQVPTGEFPRAIAVNPDANVAVVANANGGSVTLVDLASLTPIGNIGVGAGPTGVAIDPATNNAVVTNSGFVRGQGSLGAITTATVIHLTEREVLAEIPVGSTAFGVDVDPGHQRALVANFGSSDVTLLRLPNPAPRITDIEPKTFPVGATSVTLTIRGTGFLKTSIVSVNGQDLPTTFVSSRELEAVLSGALLESLVQAQASVAGIGLDEGSKRVDAQLAHVRLNVSVSNPGPGGGRSDPDSDTADIQAENPVPVLTGLSPGEAIAGKDVLLTLRGNNFNATSSVRFVGLTLRPGAVSAQTLTVRIPADAVTPGERDVLVTNPEPGGGDSPPLTFTVFERKNEPPRVTSVTPSGIEAGSTAASSDARAFIGSGSRVRLAPPTKPMSPLSSKPRPRASPASTRRPYLRAAAG